MRGGRLGLAGRRRSPVVLPGLGCDGDDAPAGYEYDPERALWRPGRRTFLFMFGAAVAGTIVKPVSASAPEIVTEAPPGSLDPLLMHVAHARQPGGWTNRILVLDAPEKALSNLERYYRIDRSRKPLVFERRTLAEAREFLSKDPGWKGRRWREIVAREKEWKAREKAWKEGR